MSSFELYTRTIKVKKILLGLLTLPHLGWADTNLDGEHSILFDFNLNGSVESSQLQSLNFSGTTAHFVASSTEFTLSGKTDSSETVIQFTLSSRYNQPTSHYLGRRHAAGSYKGTWYDEDGNSGDWSISGIGTDTFQNCKQILDNGYSDGDGLYNITTEAGNQISVYCDMTTDDGGWTLVGTYPQTASGGIKNISEYPTIPETSPSSPNNLWLYQWDVSHFSDVREQVSCSTENCADGKTVYAESLSENSLNIIRFSWGYEDRVHYAPMNADFPSCTKEYNGGQEYTGCTAYPQNNSTDTVIGWQTDLYGTTHCWAARGSVVQHLQGSSRCVRNGDPNSTKWALLWMR